VKGISAETFGSRWVWEKQPGRLYMEVRCRNAGRTLPSEGVSAMTSAIVDESGIGVFFWGQQICTKDLRVLAAALLISLLK
jgi:hypothetical protein